MGMVVMGVQRVCFLLKEINFALAKDFFFPSAFREFHFRVYKKKLRLKRIYECLADVDVDDDAVVDVDDGEFGWELKIFPF